MFGQIENENIAGRGGGKIGHAAVFKIPRCAVVHRRGSVCTLAEFVYFMCTQLYRHRSSVCGPIWLGNIRYQVR